MIEQTLVSFEETKENKKEESINRKGKIMEGFLRVNNNKESPVFKHFEKSYNNTMYADHKELS